MRHASSTLNREQKQEKHEWVEKVIDMLNFASDFASVAVVGVPVEQRKLLNRLLFQEFDRKTVFLARGGKNSCTLLDIGQNSRTRACDYFENPAERVLGLVVMTRTRLSGCSQIVWQRYQERPKVEDDTVWLAAKISSKKVQDASEMSSKLPKMFSAQLREFAMPFSAQYSRITTRVISKLVLGRIPRISCQSSFYKPDGTIAGMLFVGFSFYMSLTVTFAGMQNVIFSVFMIITIQPWKAFIIASVIVESPSKATLGRLIIANVYSPGRLLLASAHVCLLLLFMVQLMRYARSFVLLFIAGPAHALASSSQMTILLFLSSHCNRLLHSLGPHPGFLTFMYGVLAVS
ncbi:hypothetical protein CEK25_002888 [Fusarium fujikuroi]|nr:hypothetical protein CEK25_002888 [Fusarium fujikuroi]